MEKKLATFAGGCFWCMVAAFESLLGAESVTAGFTRGTEENPSYVDVVMVGNTGHIEAIQVIYQPTLCSYEKLLNLYWRQIDPTDNGGQFTERGFIYSTAIFYHSEEQRLLAEQSKKNLQESGVFCKPIVTVILPAMPFYPAEEFHQGYHKKNPEFYCQYRSETGRDDFIEKIWSPGKNEEKVK